MNKTTVTNYLLSVIALLLLINIYFIFQKNNILPSPSVNTPTPIDTITPIITTQTSTINWNQQGIPVVRGEFAHYNSSDDCVALVIDQPITTYKSLDTYVKDYSSPWQKNYPRYPIQFKVGNYQSITLEAMNAEELSNTFVKNGDLVYKMTAMMISNSGPPRCLLDYNSALADLLSGLRFNQPMAGTQELGYIKKAYIKDKQYLIDIDFADWVDDPSTPNGFKISNLNSLVRTLKVNSSAKVYLIDWTDKGMIIPQISFEELISVIKGTSANYNLGPGSQLFDIELDKNGLATKISLRYIP